jgi:hypothetical protein
VQPAFADLRRGERQNAECRMQNAECRSKTAGGPCGLSSTAGRAAIGQPRSGGAGGARCRVLLRTPKCHPTAPSSPRRRPAPALPASQLGAAATDHFCQRSSAVGGLPIARTLCQDPPPEGRTNVVNACTRQGLGSNKQSGKSVCAQVDLLF